MSSLKEKYEQLRAGYPETMRSSLVLPLLQFAQEQRGYVVEEDAAAIAECAGVPTMQVKEAMTWYSMLSLEPRGRHVVKVCRNISCSLRGCERIVSHLEQKLGIAVGETTADRRFTLLEVECLAACDAAPVIQINDTHHDRVSEAAVDRILGDLA